MIPFRFSETDVPHVRFTDRTDRHPEPRVDLLRRALPPHQLRTARAPNPAVAFVGDIDAAGEPQVCTALVLVFAGLPAERANAVRTRLGQFEFAYLLYSLFGHQLKGDDDSRFCVVVPLARPLPLDQHEAVWAALDSDLGGLAQAHGREPITVVPVPMCPVIRLGRAVYEWRDGPALEADALVGPTRWVPDDDGPAPRRLPLPPCRLDVAALAAGDR